MPTTGQSAQLPDLPLSGMLVTHLEGYRYDESGLKVWVSQQQEANYVCCQFSFASPAAFAVEVEHLDFIGGLKADAGFHTAAVAISSESDLLNRIHETARENDLDDSSAQLHVRIYAREFVVNVVCAATPIVTSMSEPPPGALFGPRLS